ncbi:hypothetical protein [Labedaea rhizosphaerae]|uniref:DUF5666 domain-containing protein n=1 Tax=Labedaea rhizosphaerae TaxID=598644 RepID=A0A4R6SI62_LABRH|nr:hypothetical protein [Labedaea rhizosphaerae]TDQ00559.1 hypothetical protein EV186_102420 [Labedaea rhizosphaerae]
MNIEPSTEPTAEQIVATPAVEGDLNTDMRRAARPVSKPTMVLAGMTAAVVVFAAGAWTHAALGSTSNSGPARGQNFPQGYGRGNAGTTGTTGATGTTGRATTGTIESIDGTKLTLRTAQGGEVTVSTTDSTTVSVSQKGELSDLKPGAKVVVQVQQGDDGALTTSSITQQTAR